MSCACSFAPGAAMRSAQRGASMIEVLVSILIVSMGVLALAGLLTVSSRLGKTSEFRAAAAMLAADMADRMRANRPGADGGDYALEATEFASSLGTESKCAVATACSAAEVAAQDMAEWQARLFKSLPQGTGAVAYTAQSGVADVWVAWSDPKAVADGDNALINASLDEARCPPGFDLDTKPTCLYFRVGL